MKYRVEFVTTITHSVIVFAKDEDEAEEFAREEVEANPEAFEIPEDTITMDCVLIEESED